MKILHVVDRMDPKAGGVCQAIRMIIEALSHYDIENEVVSVDDPKVEFNDPFRIFSLGPAKNSWQFSKELFPWLERNILYYDVIIIHGLWQYYGFGIYKILKRKAAIPKLYIMPHGMLDPYFQNAPDRKLKAIRNKIYWRLIENYIINKSDAVLFTCKKELELARLPFKPYMPKSEKVIGLGIKPPPLNSEEILDLFYENTGISKNENFILFLGRIHNKKGLDLLVEAYIQLLDSYELPKLVIAGPGLESDYGNTIKRMILKQPKFEEYFIFTGMLEGDLKWGAFYACEAFILPSHQENFGIATVEALACGKPVLISNQVNIFNEIEVSNAGLIEADTFKGTVRLLQSWLCLSKEERQIKGENALKCYQTKFTEKSIAQKILEICCMKYEKNEFESTVPVQSNFKQI